MFPKSDDLNMEGLDITTDGLPTCSTSHKERYLAAFGLAFIMALVSFLYPISLSIRIFCLLRDFNAQQIPFYKLAHAAVRNLDIAGFRHRSGRKFHELIQLLSPRQPLLLADAALPNSFIPHLMGPLLILKFSCASLTAYAFITKFVKNKTVLRGIMYAFSGFRFIISSSTISTRPLFISRCCCRSRAFLLWPKTARDFSSLRWNFFVDFKLLFLLRHGHFHGDIFCREMGVGEAGT